MRYFLILILIIFTNSVYSSEWNERVSQLIDVYEKSESDPKPVAYPELAKRVKNVFLINDKNRIEVSIYENGKIFSQTEIFYSEGELFVAQQKDGWNLVTSNNSIYEWKNGEKEGIRIEKKDNDIVDYILYLTDPAFFMTALYHGYKTDPDKYDVKIIEGTPPLRQLVLKEPLYGFKSVSVDEDDFWFYGFVMENPENKKEYIYSFSKSEKYTDKPKFLLKKMKKVKFKDSSSTLRRHMRYL